MNDDRAFERATRDWLESGSDRTSSATIDAVLLAIRTTPQERGQRIPWRTITMSKSMRFALTLAAVVVIGVGALALLRNVPPVGVEPTPSPTASSTATATATAGPSPTATATPSPTATPIASTGARIPHGPLAPGTYTTTVLTPPITFTTVAGWINSTETSDRITLYVTDTAHQVSIVRVTGDPLVYARPNADYEIGAPVATTVGGLPAQETSVVLSATAQQRSFYPLSALADSAAQGGDATLDLVQRGTDARVITIDVAGTQVVILVQLPIGDSTDFAALAQALIDSLAFN